MRKKYKNSGLLVLSILLFLSGYSQMENNRGYLTVGITYNPFLAIIDKKQEIGPAFSFGIPVNKRFEAGINLFARQEIVSPNNRYLQRSNLTTSYNWETIYNAYLGINFSKRKIGHQVFAAVGFRHHLYKEHLENPLYEIKHTYQSSEWNLIYGVGYSCRFKFSSRSALSLRLFMPLNGHPFDDFVRYSIEPAVTYKL